MRVKMAQLPHTLEQFLRQRIDSVGELEALLLAFRSPGRSWAAPEVASRLYVGENEARSILARLVDHGLLEEIDGKFVFRPRDEALAPQVEELEKFYATHLIAISNLIHSKKSARIQEFADAFTLKRRK